VSKGADGPLDSIKRIAGLCLRLRFTSGLLVIIRHSLEFVIDFTGGFYLFRPECER